MTIEKKVNKWDKPVENLVKKPLLYHLDPLKYYQVNYAGFTRGQLKNADSNLYQTIRRLGLIGNIPKKSS